jgi:hypothetical protein
MGEAAAKAALDFSFASFDIISFITMMNSDRVTVYP